MEEKKCLVGSDFAPLHPLFPLQMEMRKNGSSFTHMWKLLASYTGLQSNWYTIIMTASVKLMTTKMSITQ